MSRKMLYSDVLIEMFHVTFHDVNKVTTFALVMFTCMLIQIFALDRHNINGVLGRYLIANLHRLLNTSNQKLCISTLL